MDPKIVVIGAGAAGIAAATKLLEIGFKNVLVLEAEGRIGGRIHTVRFGENVLDMGAQWCHGERGNVIYQMANKYNVFDSSQAQYNRFDCVRSNGEYIPTYLTDRLTAMIAQILEEAKEDLKAAKGISVGTYLCKRYEDLLNDPKNYHIDRELAVQFLEMYQKYECSVDAADTLFEVSGPGFLTYWECEGSTLTNWKDRGFVTVLDIMMGKFPEGPHSKNVLDKRILLNKKVEKIVWDSRENSKVLVKCEDGDHVEADHVICTASLGVLKERHTQLFSPKLPIEKVRAIESFTLGTVNKLFIEFEKPFWPAGWVGFNLVWTKDDLQNIRRCKDNWLEDVFGFYMVDYQPNVLCGWISGVNARRMEMVPEKQVLEGLMFLLRKFLKWNIPDPVNFKRSTWYTNPNFRGSYSFFSLKAEQMEAKQAHLAKPVSRHTEGPPVLLFAGEATHDHYYSTVHGAIETGWREAHRIASFYSRRKSQL